MIQTIDQLNEENKKFWRKHSAEATYFMQRQYGRAFLRRTFVERTNIGHESPEERLARFRREEPLETQLIRYCESTESFGDKRFFAAEQRRKSKSGLALREIIADFSSRPNYRVLSAKQLWPFFFSCLEDLQLKPGHEASADIYVYRGARGKQIRLSFRQFQKIISDVSPRRKWR